MLFGFQPLFITHTKDSITYYTVATVFSVHSVQLHVACTVHKKCLLACTVCCSHEASVASF